jgi:hypothetical protein
MTSGNVDQTSVQPDPNLSQDNPDLVLPQIEKQPDSLTQPLPNSLAQQPQPPAPPPQAAPQESEEGGREQLHASFETVDTHDPVLVRATFTSLKQETKGQIVFAISLIKEELTWELMEDMQAIQSAVTQLRQTDGGLEQTMAINKLLIDFWKKYIYGGLKSIPLEHTMTAFQSLAQYMSAVMGTTSKN